MGKVVKAVAVIAVAAAIAYFAPQLGLSALHAFGSTAAAGSFAAAVASTVVATSIAVAASLAFQLVSWAPDDQASGVRLSTNVRDAIGLAWVNVPPAEPHAELLAPIEPRSWRHAFFFPWQRTSIIRLSGDCMEGYVEPGARWAIE